MVRKLFVVIVMLAGAAHADVVTECNRIASTVITSSSHTGPVQLLDFAVMHIAMHDAVQSIEGRYKTYGNGIPGASGSVDAAAATAARDVLVNRFPAQAASIDTTFATLGINPADPGVGVGHRAAESIIALRADDGSFPVSAAAFTGNTATGQWRPTPAAFASMVTPWLANVKPLSVKSASQFRPKAPPELTSSEYTADFNEVKKMGAATGSGRTTEQTEVALFWSDNTPVLWNRGLRMISATYVDDVGDNARLFALANIAAIDAIISCWDTKIHYNYWRPITAIQNAAIDGNPATDPDTAWTPLIATPAYPDYSSGANAVTGAMTVILERFFGTDELPVSLSSNVTTLPADKRTRSYSRFSDIATEVVEARILLGIHFRFADTAAREQGMRTAKWTYTHVLKPVDEIEHMPRTVD